MFYLTPIHGRYLLCLNSPLFKNTKHIFSSGSILRLIFWLRFETKLIILNWYTIPIYFIYLYIYIIQYIDAYVIILNIGFEFGLDNDLNIPVRVRS